MKVELDDHGQPVIAAFNRARRTERDISELLGLAKGLLADGEISPAEADLVRDWIFGHPDAADIWPANRITERLYRIYADGRADEPERKDLCALLTLLVGEQGGIIACQDTPSDLPLNRPAPPLQWKGRVYVFTGQMAFGPRTECERHVNMFGGVCASSITRQTNYLVVGTFGSRDWAHTSFGRKIQKAVHYRDSGHPLAIIAEDHWAAQLPAHVSGGTVVLTGIR